jgi:hypothetical protein
VGATVAITNVLSGVAQRVTTNVHGVYDVPSVPPGEYTISFEREGFGRFNRTGIVLHLETITVDATLRIGSTTQSIEVTGAARLVQTETPERSTTITTTAITDTSNVGQSWYILLGLIPGVSGGVRQGANGEGASVNSQGGQQYNWQIDGGHAMFTNNQNPDILATPLDAIQETKLVTGNLGAEYGNGLAVFNVTTKSGTNAWHGDLFEYVQNDKLEAPNYFSPGNLPLRWNEFGGTVGGPIRRDKAFFFFGDSPGFANMPTGATRSGNFTAPVFPTVYDPATLQQVNGNWLEQPFDGNSIPANRFDPVASAILRYFPQPNLPRSVLNYYYTARVPQTTQWISGNIDYNVSSSNHITGSLMATPNCFSNPAPICAIDCTTGHNREDTAQLTDVRTFGPQFVGEFRFSMVHMHGELKPLTLDQGYPARLGLNNPACDVFPSVTIDGVSAWNIGEQGWPLAIDAESAFVPAGDADLD